MPVTETSTTTTIIIIMTTIMMMMIIIIIIIKHKCKQGKGNFKFIRLCIILIVE